MELTLKEQRKAEQLLFSVSAEWWENEKKPPAPPVLSEQVLEDARLKLAQKYARK